MCGAAVKDRLWAGKGTEEVGLDSVTGSEPPSDVALVPASFPANFSLAV